MSTPMTMDGLGTALRAAPAPATTLDAWWTATCDARAAHLTTIERALAGGGLADRLGFAFACGYAEALHALVPSLAGELSALCATEAGGAHPRAIQTRLVRHADGGWRVTGEKQWATWAGAVRSLLVVASTGVDDANVNRLRVVRVPAHAAGVTVAPSAAPFVPEVPHARVVLDDVAVDDGAVLPGDGYDAYLKPFRTIEDIHVHAAVVGYLAGVVRRRDLGRDHVEALAMSAMALRQLAMQPTDAPTTHVALAGVIAAMTRTIGQIDAAWSTRPDEEWQRWQRDRPLLQVAGKARAARRERAWDRLTSAST